MPSPQSTSINSLSIFTNIAVCPLPLVGIAFDVPKNFILIFISIKGDYVLYSYSRVLGNVFKSILTSFIMVNRSVSFGILIFFVMSGFLLFVSDYSVFTGNAISSRGNIVVTMPERISVSEGQVFDISVDAINFGDKSLDSCNFVFSGDKSFSISGDSSEDLSQGEKQSYILNVDAGNLPEGIYSINYLFSCDQEEARGKTYLDVSGRDFNFYIDKAESEGEILSVPYKIYQLIDSEQKIVLSYEIRDFSGKEISSWRDEIVLGEKGTYEGVLTLDNPSEGHAISVKADNGKDSILLERDIGYPSSAVTGFSVYEGNGKGNPVFIIIFSVILLLAALGFLRKKEAKGSAFQREFIKLNLQNDGNL